MWTKFVFVLGLCGALFAQFPTAKGWDGKVVFQNEDDSTEYDSTEEETAALSKNGLPDTIPLSLARILSNAESLNDLLPILGNAVEVEVNGERKIISNSKSESDMDFTRTIERSNVIQAVPANCKPELKTVELVEKPDPSIFYLPSCTRIERCGGCCSSELLTCEPTQIEIVNMQITKMQYRAGSNKPMRLAGKEVVPVEKHLSCKCDCKVKAKDCNALQTYSKNDCKCTCTNSEEKKKCEADSDKKIWDFINCICNCREQKLCPSGYAFDQNSCRCEADRRRQVYETLTNQDSGPAWINQYENVQRQKQKKLHGEKEEKNKPVTIVNLFRKQ